MYVIEDDDGFVLDSVCLEFTSDVDRAMLFDEPIAPAEYAKRYGGHVVELMENPEPVVVSEEEAEMLKKAKDTTIWRPAAVISKYAYNAAKDYGQEALLEDRLMRAYVIGWTVDKPKRWNVKVPHVNNGYYYKDSDGLAVFTATRGRMLQERSRFTEAEIDHYGLQDCERIPVAN
jgi:hypothetical protein